MKDRRGEVGERRYKEVIMNVIEFTIPGACLWGGYSLCDRRISGLDDRNLLRRCSGLEMVIMVLITRSLLVQG
jgi:hypothetical protein